jgi:hypothetical protein
VHSFAVVVAKQQRQVPAHVREVLRAAESSDLWFVPDDHVCWHDDAERTWFGGWQAGAAGLGVGSRWEVRPDGLTAFSGHLWHHAAGWQASATWASQLADLFNRAPLDSIGPGLDGVFAAVSLQADGRGTITADPLGIAVLYQAESDDVTVISNRAALAARLITPEGRHPDRDVEGAGWMVYAGVLQDARTTFTGVTAVPQASFVRLRPGAAPSIDTWSATPWHDGHTLGTIDDALAAVGTVAQQLRSLVRLFAAVPCRMHTLELTGGHDSRLVLALLLDEGLASDFVYVTWGGEDLPDVQVASAIADRFGLDLRAAGRARAAGFAKPGGEGEGATKGASPAGEGMVGKGAETVSYEDHLRRHVGTTSGALSIWDLSPVGRTPSPNLAVTGLFGETLRTNYARAHGATSFDELAVYVRTGQFGFDGGGFMRTDARRRYDELVIEQIERSVPAGGSPQDAVDGYYQMARLRRWVGATEEIETRNRMFPLYSLPAIRLAFAIGPELRRRQCVHFEVMRAACDELARMPFAGSAWPDGVDVHLPADDAGYPTSDPKPLWSPPAPAVRRVRTSRWRGRARAIRSRAAPRSSSRPPGGAGEAGRMRDIDEKLPVLLSFLDLDRNHPLFDLVDRDRLLAAAKDIESLPYHGRRGVHDAVTAAIWLSREERPGPGPRSSTGGG